MAKSDRPYGVEYTTDVYDAPCKDGCRLGPDSCALASHCRLEVGPGRRDRCFSAHYDNRRGILYDLNDPRDPTTIVTTAKSQGLPANDPIAVTASAISPSPDGGCPTWHLVAENYHVDGDHTITLEALRRRIDNHAIRRKRP